MDNKDDPDDFITRADFIEDFVEGLENFLKGLGRGGYTLGNNKGHFKHSFARWWFAMTRAARTGQFVSYEGHRPYHRNHPYDYTKFMDLCDSAVFDPFVRRYTVYGFCDDETSEGEMTRQELKMFLYYNIDMRNSPAREEIDKILREEEEEKREREEDINRSSYSGSGKRWGVADYDVSELGVYRGDRIMGP